MASLPTLVPFGQTRICHQYMTKSLIQNHTRNSLYIITTLHRSVCGSSTIGARVKNENEQPEGVRKMGEKEKKQHIEFSLSIVALLFSTSELASFCRDS